MSARKKAVNTDIKTTFQTIKDLLLTIRPQLDGPINTTRASLVHDLHLVASSAGSITDNRSKEKDVWAEIADNLDQAGVNLWNISGLIRKHPVDDGPTLIAALRLAAFRLVEAGMELKPGIESLLHILQIASKTGVSLSEVGSNAMAGTVLASAAKFEEMLRNASDSDGVHGQAIACATIVYFSSRMEAAWKEGNYTVADFMSHKITDDDQRLALLPPHLRELLASKLHSIGKSILKEEPGVQSGTRAEDAVSWIQKALALAEKVDDTVAPTVAVLKVSILRALARAYFLSGLYDRAEAALDELLPSIDSSNDHASPEYQELRWQKLAILKRRKAGDTALLDDLDKLMTNMGYAGYKTIIDHMVLSETSITDVLQDLRTLSHQHTLVTAVNQYCLQRALRCHGTDSEYVSRLLLSLIFHCAKDEDHARAMKTLGLAFTSVCEAEVELPNMPVAACVNLIWQYGDRHFHAKRWPQAAEWYLAGSHALFRTNSSASTKCYRKAALCYIEHREYAQASTVIRRCPTNEAATHYVIFLTAVHQGLEDEAIKAIQEMVDSPDFDRNMILLATQISHQAEMKTVLLSALGALLKTLKAGASQEDVIEEMALIRCVIRLGLKLQGEPLANKNLLIDTVMIHFHKAKVLTEAACANNSIASIIKDVSWLWKTAYNTAVQGCSEWESKERLPELFDITRELLEMCCHASPVDVDVELYLHLMNTSFSAVAGRVFQAREVAASVGNVDATRIRGITAEIRNCKKRILEILDKNKVKSENDLQRIQYMIYMLRIFEAEMFVQLKEWDQLSRIVGEAVASGPMATSTCEALADLLWADKDCPINVLNEGLEAILRASLDRNMLSVEKFSRWLRAICSIILLRNTPADRIRAIGYIEQALSVMGETLESDNPYPMDERQWLLATAYNTGAECLQASLLDEAKRWFEASTIMCKFVPGGSDQARKISDTYKQLLARYGGQK